MGCNALGSLCATPEGPSLLAYAQRLNVLLFRQPACNAPRRPFVADLLATVKCAAKAPGSLRAMPEGPESQLLQVDASLAWCPPPVNPIKLGSVLFFGGGSTMLGNCMLLLMHSKRANGVHKRKRNAAKSTQAKAKRCKSMLPWRGGPPLTR